jgi:hypothetical protein
MSTPAQRLIIVGSENRAPVLVRECQQASVDEARELLRDWWTVCDAAGSSTEGLREQFARVGFVSDTEKELELPAVVYRAGWHDDDAEQALSWTLEFSKAEWWARYLTSVRAWFVGIRREDATPTIYQGVCTHAYGYFIGRDEAEVIAAKVLDVHVIATLEPAEPSIWPPIEEVRATLAELEEQVRSRNLDEGRLSPPNAPGKEK